MSTGTLRRPPSADQHRKGTLLALAVHALLLLALALGVNWRSRDATPLSAELWSTVPQVAAPEPVAAPPPAALPRPAAEAPKPQPAAPAPQEAEIATEKKVTRPRPEEKVPDEKAQAQAREAERRRLQEEARRQEEMRQKELQARTERLREENLRRLAAQLPGSAPAPSPGTDTVTAAPSASYAGRVRARIFPNVRFLDLVPSQAIAEVEIKVAPDGKITSRRLVKSSGVPAWDEAVLAAIDRTDQLPLDEGRAPPPAMQIEFDANKR
jgi:colicin import membrane protein